MRVIFPDAEIKVVCLVYYPTLAREIAGRGIKKKVIAESLNICNKSLNNKLTGRAPFTWPEVIKIRDRFFPDMTTEYLFARSENGEKGT